MEGLSGQGVVAESRITLHCDGNEKPTQHVILTFNKTTLPKSVKAGYRHCKVRPFIPNSRRCFKCQRFEHSSATCRGKASCARCGSVSPYSIEHCGQACRCVNCSGSHAAYSHSCPSWKREKGIIALQTKENISYPKARRRVSFLHGGTFAVAVHRGPAPPSASKDSMCCLSFTFGGTERNSFSWSLGIAQHGKLGTSTSFVVVVLLYCTKRIGAMWTVKANLIISDVM